MGRAGMALVVGVAAVGLTGCFGSGGGSSTATTVTGAATTAPAASPTAALTLARGACQEYTAAVATPNTAIGYPDLFQGDAEADQAERLNPSTWTQLATTLDTVKSQIQSIDSLQSASQSYSTSQTNAASLSQALGTLKGDLSAVQILCTASGA